MLTALEIPNSPTRTFNFDDADPSETLVIKSISGLSSNEAGLFLGDYARDGGYYQGRRVGKRNIVINFKINPNYTSGIDAESIRDSLYRKFYEPGYYAPATTGNHEDLLTLNLVSDNFPRRFIRAACERVECDMFARGADLTAQVSLVSPQPYLQSVALVDYTRAGSGYNTNIAYAGSAKVGIFMQISVLASTERVFVSNGFQTMTFKRPDGVFFKAGDYLQVNTRQGERQVNFNGAAAMYLVQPGSSWIQLNQSVATISVYGSAVNDGLARLNGYNYRAQWWGI